MKTSSTVGHRQVGEYLEWRARTLGTEAPLYYDLLANHFSLPEVTKDWSKHPLCRIFEQLDEEDALAGRPFRTVLVISQKQMIPGPSFFKKHAELHAGKPEAISKRDKSTLCKAEFARLLHHYGTNKKALDQNRTCSREPLLCSPTRPTAVLRVNSQ